MQHFRSPPPSRAAGFFPSCRAATRPRKITDGENDALDAARGLAGALVVL